MSDLVKRLQADAEWNSAPQVDLDLPITAALEREAAAEIERLTAELAAAKEWKSAVIDELITSWAITAEHETNPRKAVQDAISWEVQIALDPMVSSDAQKLIDSGKAKHYEECAVIAKSCQSGFGAAHFIRAALTDTKE